MPSIYEQYAHWQVKIQEVQEKLRKEMRGVLQLPAPLPDYRTDISSKSIGSQNKHLFHHPYHLMQWACLENKKSIDDMDINELNALEKRIVNLCSVQGGISIANRDWAQVLHNDFSSNPALAAKLKELEDRAKDGSWLKFNTPIMQDPRLGLYALMLFTLDRLDLDLYINLTRAAGIIEEYPPLWDTVDLINDYTINHDCLPYIESLLSMTNPGRMLTEADKQNIFLLLQEVPAQQRKLVRVFFPHYNHLPLERFVDNIGQRDKNYYYFLPFDIYNRLQFINFHSNYIASIVLNGPISSYGFISVQQMTGLKPASLSHTTFNNFLFDTHKRKTNRTVLTDHDILFHSTSMSNFDPKFIQAVFDLTIFLKETGYFTPSTVPDFLNKLNDFTIKDKKTSILDIVNQIPIAARSYIILAGEKKEKTGIIDFAKQQPAYEELDNLYKKLLTAEVMHENYSLKANALYLSFYYQLYKLIKNPCNNGIINEYVSVNYNEENIPSTFDNFLLVYKENLQKVKIVIDKTKNTYCISYNDQLILEDACFYEKDDENEFAHIRLRIASTHFIMQLASESDRSLLRELDSQEEQLSLATIQKELLSIQEDETSDNALNLIKLDDFYDLEKISLKNFLFLYKLSFDPKSTFIFLSFLTREIPTALKILIPLNKQGFTETFNMLLSETLAEEKPFDNRLAKAYCMAGFFNQEAFISSMEKMRSSIARMVNKIIDHSLTYPEAGKFYISVLLKNNFIDIAFLKNRFSSIKDINRDQVTGMVYLLFHVHELTNEWLLSDVTLYSIFSSWLSYTLVVNDPAFEHSLSILVKLLYSQDSKPKNSCQILDATLGVVLQTMQFQGEYSLHWYNTSRFQDFLSYLLPTSPQDLAVFFDICFKWIKTSLDKPNSFFLAREILIFINNHETCVENKASLLQVKKDFIQKLSVLDISEEKQQKYQEWMGCKNITAPGVTPQSHHFTPINN